MDTAEDFENQSSHTFFFWNSIGTLRLFCCFLKDLNTHLLYGVVSYS